MPLGVRGISHRRRRTDREQTTAQDGLPWTTPIAAASVQAGPGRGAAGKTPFVAAVATTDDGKPDQIILRRVKTFSNFAIGKLAGTALVSGIVVVSNGLRCFTAVTQAGCTHVVIKTGGGAKAAKTPAFKWVNTVLGNIKAAIVGTYRAVREKHVPRISPNSNIGSTADTSSKK